MHISPSASKYNAEQSHSILRERKTDLEKKHFICSESYKNEEELFNLQCWALTCESFFSKKEWIWILKNAGYSGDYEFIYFS